eukprot:g17932.t1
MDSPTHRAGGPVMNACCFNSRGTASSSPATGLIGMQENGFLGDFFRCMGFLSLASESTIRGAMVEVMLAGTPPQRQRHPGAPSPSCSSPRFVGTMLVVSSRAAMGGQAMSVTRCEHAIVVVGEGIVSIPRLGIQDAEAVVFGQNEEGVLGVADRAAKQLHLSRSGLSDVVRMAAMAQEHGMPLLMRLGETQNYVVYHSGDGSIDASWAVVECDVAQAGGVAAARARRRTTAKKSFTCKANGGTLCGGARKSRSERWKTRTPDGERKEICSVQEVCTMCNEELCLLRKETITAVVPELTLEELANRALTNNYLKKKLLDAYLCFEALTEHPYTFSSYKHGYFPLLSQWDSCNKTVVNISVEGYFRQRKEHVKDMDLDWVWLIISMLSLMVFGSTKVQLSYSTQVAFCPHNWKSNVITIPARGKARQPGDVEAADGKALVQHVEENGEWQLLDDMLEGMTKDELDALYRKCFGKNGPGMSRYTTKPLMQELSKAVAKLWREDHFGKEYFAKFFVDRGGALLSSGVEGGYSADGVVGCHMFMMRAESPADLAVLLLHLQFWLCDAISGDGGEGPLLPLKRSAAGGELGRFSASPATGLIGLQENEFLGDFFRCLGFLSLASESIVRGAMVKVMLAGASLQHKRHLGTPSSSHSSPGHVGKDAGGVGESSEDMDGSDWSNALAAEKGPAALPRDPSTCALWCAIVLGALVQGYPLDHVKSFQCLKLANGIVDALPSDEIPRGFRELLKYAGFAWAIEPALVSTEDTNGYWENVPPVWELSDRVVTEQDVCGFLLSVVVPLNKPLMYETSVGHVLATKQQQRQLPEVAPVSTIPNVEHQGLRDEDEADRVCLKNIEACAEEQKSVMPEMLRLAECIETSGTRFGLGGLMYYGELTYLQLLSKQASMRELKASIQGLHYVHILLQFLALFQSRQGYEATRVAYNSARPVGSLPAPPFQEWRMSDVCDHVCCRACDGFARRRCSFCIETNQPICHYRPRRLRRRHTSERGDAATQAPAPTFSGGRSFRGTDGGGPPFFTGRRALSAPAGSGCGGNRVLLPLKRGRFSASPATGLIGLQENEFLGDFFGCLGFLSLASEGTVRGAIVSIMVAGVITTAPVPPNGTLSAAPLVRGAPLDNVGRYVEYAQDALRACCDGSSPPTVGTARAYVAMAILHNFLGEPVTHKEYVKLANGIVDELPPEDIPRGFRAMMQYAGFAWASETRLAPAEDSKDFWENAAPIWEPFVDETGVGRVLWHASRVTPVSTLPPTENPDLQDAGVDRVCLDNVEACAEVQRKSVMPEMLRLEECIENSKTRNGLGGLLYYGNLAYLQLLDKDPALKVSFKRCLDVLLRYPGLCRYTVWAHSAHCKLNTLAMFRSQREYEALRASYNSVRPVGSRPAPPFEEWRDVTDICDHGGCRRTAMHMQSLFKDYLRAREGAGVSGSSGRERMSCALKPGAWANKDSDF